MSADQRYLELSELEDEVEHLRRLLWSADQEKEGLISKLQKRDRHIEDLKSKLDKFKSVLFLRPSHSSGSGLSFSEEVCTSPGTSQAGLAPFGPRQKRVAISAEPQRGQTADIQKHPKSDRSRELIKAALLDNDFLRHLDLEQICEMVECMYPVDVAKNCLIIREGDDGSLVYVMEEGTVEVTKDGRYLCTLSPGKVFGELAILYNCTRTASVRANTACRLWAINRQTFQAIMMKTGMAKHSEYVQILQSIATFRVLSDEEVHKLADLLEEEVFKYNEFIARQGSHGSTFFIISKGQVRVTENASPGASGRYSGGERVVKTLAVGDYFGEQALTGDEVRIANYIVNSPDGCTCLTIDKETYEAVVIRKREEKSQLHSPLTPRQPSFSANELGDCCISDLEVLSTLGIGGFGRVELVRRIGDPTKSYALKVMKKKHIVDTKQQTHIMNERSTMFDCRSEFIVRLHKTFRDSKYLYMLMESCLGGEVWSLLRDRSRFDEETAKFYTACAMEAIEYLQRRGIVYRDLKPENMLLDAYGFAKLVDFGFAKKIGFSSKTWTFCGTPEYVAPEVILNKGHDFAVDFWSLGVFIYELLTGTPPFVAPDPMRTYNAILKGIDGLEFPRYVSKNAIVIVKKLCREAPNERLGCGRGGFNDVKRNRWFEAFNFDGLKGRTLQPPIIPNVKSPTDISNFDNFPPEDEPEPPDDLSGWDEEF